MSSNQELVTVQVVTKISNRLVRPKVNMGMVQLQYMAVTKGRKQRHTADRHIG